MKKVLGNKKYIVMLSAPAAILYSMFVLYPIVNVFIMSLQKTDGLSQAEFVGIENFRKLLNDKEFISANIRSLGLCLLAIVAMSMVAIALAMVMSTLSNTVQRIIRFCFLIPTILSVSAISQLWLAIYHADWGLLNAFLDKIGLSWLANEWLINSKTAIICIAIVGMWWCFGLQLLMACSGVKSIADSYYEAAKLDGANFFEISRFITLPLLKDVTRTCIIVSATGGLYTFPQVFIMTGGGPGDLTQTIMIYMYKQAFSNQRFGLAGAVAVIAIIETAVIIAVISRLLKTDKQII